MNWGFPVAWLSVVPVYTKDAVILNLTMLVGMLWYVQSFVYDLILIGWLQLDISLRH